MPGITQAAPEQSSAPSQEGERNELDSVAAALSKSSRLLRLVRYIGDKYFQGELDKLHEYSIATEVFGRSKTTFNASEDAIVRVEAHRLRKRLKEFYENEGKDHPIQLSIPPGTYIPVFTHVVAADEKNQNPGFLSVLTGWRWFYPFLSLVLVIAALGGYWLFRSGAVARVIRSATASPRPQSNAGPVPLGPASLPIRIIAGYSGKPQIDSAGAVWQPDSYFRYGGNWIRPAGFIARTSDPMLFEQWRTGDFFYDIPLRPGVYELHLYFTTASAAGYPLTFSVGINGAPVLEGFDVNSDAMGPNVADERVFRDVSPAKDGYLHLTFTSEMGAPALNAIEVLPGLPHQQLPIRLITQPISFTDNGGQFWHPDNYFMGGYTSTRRQRIEGTSDPGLFAAERYGHFSYDIPVDTRGRYTLILHFVEFYFGPGASGPGGVGSRVFRVLCNGNTLLDNFDIYKEVGSLHVLTKTFYHLKPSAQGKLNITFEPILNNATVSGIEVLDESR